MFKLPLKSKEGRHGEISDGKTIVAPVRGWNVRDPAATMKPGFARYLENLYPTGSTVDLRPGMIGHRTGFGSPVKSLMAYHGASGSGSLWAATNAGIFDATTAGAVGVAAIALTDGWCQHTNFRTSGGSFLLVANGVDSLKSYDGTTWSSVASYSISGGGTLNTTSVVGFAVHNRRLWLVERNSTDVFYFDVNAVSGNVTRFPLGGYASSGGFVQAIGTWTVDGGAGPDDHIAFVLSKGQVIIYAGTDPSSIPTSFALRGVYNLPAPIGRRCLYKLGSDLLILTDGGVYSLTDILKGKAVTQDLALSDTIRPEVSAATQLYSENRGWQIAGLLSQNLILVNVPTTEASASYQYGMNTTSQGWWKNTGWSAICYEEFNNKLYAGFATAVNQVWAGATDLTANVVGYVRAHDDYMNQRTREKHWKQLRVLAVQEGGISVNIGLDVDFRSSLEFGSTSFPVNLGSLWDSAVWDSASWSGAPTPRLEWRTVAAKPGYSAAVRLRVVSNGGTFSWSASDLIYELGARVVA